MLQNWAVVFYVLKWNVMMAGISVAFVEMMPGFRSEETVRELSDRL